MVSTKRIAEVYRFYVYSEPSSEGSSIRRYKILRERFSKILKSNKLRSIQLAMGSDLLPIQDPIAKMSNKEFNEFVKNNTSGKRRKEIYNKNK